MFGDVIGGLETYQLRFVVRFLSIFTLKVISPLVGVKDEHFIVWMRTSGRSTFRKLYGRWVFEFDMVVFPLHATSFVLHV